MKKIVIALCMALASVAVLPTSINAQNVNNTEEQQSTSKSERKMKTKGERDGKDLKITDKAKERKDGAKTKCDKDSKGCKSKCDKAGKGKGCHKGDGKMKKCKKNPFAGIELTADQQAKLDQLRDKGREAEMKVKQDAREKKAKMREDFDNEVKKILTPEQWTKFESNKAEMQKSKKDSSNKHDGKGKKGSKKEKGMKENKDSRRK